VEKQDFDEVMLLVWSAFGLAHPDPKRFNDVFERYQARYLALSGGVVSLPDTAQDAPALKEAVKRADESFKDWYAVHVAASRATDPKQANAIYLRGIEAFPQSPHLLGNYAIFLCDKMNADDEAEKYFKLALDLDPNYALCHTNYGRFLSTRRGDIESAEQSYKRALGLSPNSFPAVSGYAVFLHLGRKNYDLAESEYRRALLLSDEDMNCIGNLGGLLLSVGKTDEGLTLVDRVLASRLPEDKLASVAECGFYAFAHRRDEAQRLEGLRTLKRLLVEGVRSSSWNLSGNIARALKDGHPHAEWLERLAAVISSSADLSILEEWDVWRKLEITHAP
jgi:Tfp pilus assembly protein PilF